MIVLDGSAPAPARASEPRTHCSAPGCTEATTGKKPFCIEHLDRLPYVAWLSKEIERRRFGSEASHGGPAESVIEHLEVHEVATVGRLSREIQAPRKAVETCVSALERAGIVECQLLPLRRGGKLRVVRLTRRALAAVKAVG